MITFTKVLPDATIDAGETAFQITVESDNFDGDTEGSFSLEVNDVVCSDATVTGSAGTWTVSLTSPVYGPQSLKIKISATDLDESKSEIWLVEVTPERTLGPERMKRAFFLDSISRYLPTYTKARGEKYSVFQQFMNAAGLELDRIKESLHQQSRALDPTRILSSDPDWLYQCQLDIGERFGTRINSLGAEEFIPPTVYGLSGINKLSLEGKSSFLDFWPRALPSRFRATPINIQNAQLTSSLSIYETEGQEAFDVPVPGHLYLWVHSVTSPVDTTDDVIFGSIRLIGEGLGGRAQTEEIRIVRNGQFPTKKIWRRVEKIVAANSSDDFYAEIVVLNFPFPDTVQEEPLFLLGGTEPLRWEWGASANGDYLDLTVSGPGYIEDLLSNLDQRVDLQRFWLLNASGDHIAIDSFYVDPTNYLLYGINDTTLFVWDRREPAPLNLIELNGAAESPEVDFFVEDNWAFSVSEGGIVSTVRIEIDTPQSLRTIGSWGWSVVTPDGDRFYRDVNGDFTSSTPFFLFNTLPISRYGIAQPNFTVDLTGTGTWIFELTIRFMDGGTEIVKKAFQVVGLEPLAQYKIDHLISGDDGNIITCLEDGRLVARNSGESVELVPMFDLFMIDFGTETIFFRENFDEVEIVNE